MKFKFIKLKVVTPRETTISWRLILETVDQLLAYADVDSRMSLEAYIQEVDFNEKENVFETNHNVRNRAHSITRILNAKLNSVSEKFQPIVEVDRFSMLKYEGMRKSIAAGKSIIINENQGWCWTKQFIEQWNAEILEERFSDNVGFPTDSHFTDIIILENAQYQHQISKDSKLKRVSSLLNEFDISGSISCIYGLQERDSNEVLKHLQNAKVIYAETSLTNVEQLEKFMTLFAKVLRHKKVFIKTFAPKTIITDHPLYTEASLFNQIVLL